MIISNAADQPPGLSDTQQLAQDAGSFISRKIWLPKVLYNALPYFYFFAGLAALFATLYISNWLWVVPHYLLFAGACLHMGLLVHRRRNRPRT